MTHKNKEFLPYLQGGSGLCFSDNYAYLYKLFKTYL